MNDKELVQLICAYRLFDEEVELSISTRESKKFRDNIIKLGITSIYILNTNIPFINGRHPEPCSIEVPFHVRVIAIESIPTFLFLL